MSAAALCLIDGLENQPWQPARQNARGHAYQKGAQRADAQQNNAKGLCTKALGETGKAKYTAQHRAGIIKNVIDSGPTCR